MAMQPKTPTGMPDFDWMKNMTSFWTDAVAKMPAGNTEMVDRIRALSGQSLAFFEERMKKDMEAAGQLAQAKSPTDAARIMFEYFQGLVADYNRQALAAAEEAGKAMSAQFGKWPGMKS